MAQCFDEEVNSAQPLPITYFSPEVNMGGRSCFGHQIRLLERCKGSHPIHNNRQGMCIGPKPEMGEAQSV